MQTVRLRLPAEAPSRALWCAPSPRRRAPSCSAAAIPTSKSPALPRCRPTIACGIRSRCRNPTARSNCSSAPTVASSIRRNAHKCCHSAWAGNAKRPAASSSRGRWAAATSTPPPTRCMRSSRSWPRAACRRRASWCRPIQRPDRIWPRSASAIREFTPRPDPAACGRRTSVRASTATISKINRRGTMAAPLRRNLAAEVDNPSDLVQPRAETPAYAARRTTVLEKYRAGQPTGEASENQAAKISDVGK